MMEQMEQEIGVSMFFVKTKTQQLGCKFHSRLLFIICRKKIQAYESNTSCISQDISIEDSLAHAL